MAVVGPAPTALSARAVQTWLVEVQTAAGLSCLMEPGLGSLPPPPPAEVSLVQLDLDIQPLATRDPETLQAPAAPLNQIPTALATPGLAPLDLTLMDRVPGDPAPHEQAPLDLTPTDPILLDRAPLAALSPSRTAGRGVAWTC